MQRIWDCHPALLSREHLLAEHQALQGMAVATLKHLLRVPGSYATDPEFLRFVERPHLLLGRHVHLVNEAEDRGVRFGKHLCVYKRFIDHPEVIMAHGLDWTDWREVVGWPPPAEEQAAAPWLALGMSESAYLVAFDA